MSDAVSTVQEALYALLQGYCLQYFLGAFLESRFPKSRWGGAFVIALYGAYKLGVNLLIPAGYESTGMIGKQMLQMLIALVLASCFYKAAHTITAFLVVTFSAISDISLFLAYMAMWMGSGLFDLWNWCFGQGYISSPAHFERIIKATAYGLGMLMYVAYALLLCFSLKKVVRNYREKDYAIHRAELLFILSPGLAGWLLCILLRVIIVTAEGEVPKLLYDTYPVLVWIVPAILLLSLCSIVYGVKLFQDMITVNREKNNRIILEKQVGSMQEHMAEMERVYSGLRGMKHDMKNTLAILMRLAVGKDGGENAELRAYLSELNHAFDRLEFPYQTGNAVVDTLLNMKCHEALRAMPDIRMDAERLLFPDSLLIQSYDIGIILGNALDNAVEACRKLKEKEPDAGAFIRLSSFRKGKMFFLEVENSFDGNLTRKRQAEFPATDKADREAHGIGLANVKRAAEKYHGAVDWSADRNVFTLSVMMQDERQDG